MCLVAYPDNKPQRIPHLAPAKVEVGYALGGREGYPGVAVAVEHQRCAFLKRPEHGLPFLPPVCREEQVNRSVVHLRFTAQVAVNHSADGRGAVRKPASGEDETVVEDSRGGMDDQPSPRYTTT